MHPLIAFLTFIFSPADDWMLKRAYQLALQETETPAIVQSYDQLARIYPSYHETPDGIVKSADAPAMSLWMEVLDSKNEHRAADEWRTDLIKDRRTPPDMANEFRLRFAESDLKNHRFDAAKKRLAEVIEAGGARTVDAEVDLLVAAVASEDMPLVQQQVKRVTELIGNPPRLKRAEFPMALAAFAQNDFAKAAELLALNESDVKSMYFLGLCRRKLGQSQLALQAWQNITNKVPGTAWAQFSLFQIGETYFAIDDNSLAYATYVKALALPLEPVARDSVLFRLASLDLKSENYASVLDRLAQLTQPSPQIEQRSRVLIADALVKTTKPGELTKALAKRIPQDGTVGSMYQTAWALSFDKRHEDAFELAEKALEGFFDDSVTPRLLLLQALAYENLGNTAEALATYNTVADRFPKSQYAARASHWLVLSYVRLNRFKEAVTHGATIWENLEIATRRTAPETAFWLAESDYKLGLLPEAEKHFDEFLSLVKPDNEFIPFALFESAAVMAKQNKSAEALVRLAEFGKMASALQKPEWVELAQLQRGNILFNGRQYEQAIASYRGLPNFPKAKFYEGAALARMDYHSDATEVWTKLAQTFPQSEFAPTALFRAGRTLFELGRATDSVATFAQLMTNYPNDPRVKDALLQSAHALYNSGDVAGAAPLYAQFLSKYHESQDLAIVTPYLAACYAQLGKSLDDMETGLKGLPPTEVLASLRWKVGAEQYNVKQFSEANNIFARLSYDTPSDENSPGALFYRAESLFLDQSWKDAEGAYTAFLSMSDKKDTDQAALAMFHKGVAMYRQDHLLKAAKVFEGLVKEFPGHNLASEAKSNALLCYYNLGAWDIMDQLKAQFDGTAIVVTTENEDKVAATPPEAQP